MIEKLFGTDEKMWLLSHLFKLDSRNTGMKIILHGIQVPRSIDSIERIKRKERTERCRGSPGHLRSPETLKESATHNWGNSADVSPRRWTNL